MVTPAWNPRIRHTRNTEPVDAPTDSRPTRGLEQQTNYLKSQLEGLESYEALYIRDAAVSEDAAVGMAVWYNTELAQFEPGLATLTADNGVVEPSAAANVRGVVIQKSSSTVALIVRDGYVRDVDLTASTGFAQPPAGRYFLSTTSPGKLTRSSASSSVEVLETDGQGNILVVLNGRNVGDNHYHFRFELVALPAGNAPQPAVGDPHVIDDADSSLTGWLPADHSIFAGQAPVGAIFGYNLSQHPELRRVFPPLPSDAAQIVLHSELNHGLGYEVQMGVNGQAIVDAAGIWWMTNCYGQSPWDPTINFDPRSSGSSSSSSSESGVCPPANRQLILYFNRSRGLAEPTAVSSLRPSAGSPITLVDCNGLPAVKGDLLIGFDGKLLITTDGEAGSLVVKDLTGQSLKRGRVLEGIVVPDDSLIITSEFSRLVDPDDSESATLHQGICTITANLTDTDRILVPSVIKVDDVRQRFNDDIMYLAFPAVQSSSIRAKFKVPPIRVPTGSQARFRAWIFGDKAGTLPDLKVSWRRIPVPDTGGTDIPTNDAFVTFPDGMSTDANVYREMVSDPVTIVAGDVLLFSLLRSEDDGYTGEVGVLDIYLSITPP